jgi:signal transduction histidine kinase/ActR/RegA family two-component response regulator
MTKTTLRGQLTRASVMTALVALLLNAALILAYEFDRARGELVDDLRTQAVILARSVEPALVFNDPEAALRQLSSLHDRQDIIAATVIGPDDKPFARYVGPSAGPDAESMPFPALAGRAYRYEGHLIELAHDVEHDGERVGTVQLLARHDLLRRISTYAAIEAAVLAVSLGFALLVFGRLQEAITAPIGRIVRVAQDVVDRHDWHLRAPSADNEEIAVLSEAFNRMLQEVEAATAELRREMAVRLHAEDELRAADRKKDEFLATLAHEIRNPLAPMMNAISLMRRDDARPALRERSLEILDRQMRHVVRLIDDLLDVSRITTGKLSLHMENVDLVPVVRASLELIEPVVRSRQLQVQADLPDEPCVLVGDAARLLQVFSNLLTNACRYTPPGGRISVTLRRRGEQIDTHVSDTGVGIEPAMQERIFDLFEQGDKTLERGNTGLGIGLTLARQLVRLHGGTIEVTSRGIGQGSTFTVVLPAPVGAVTPSEAPVEPAAPQRGPLRVLLADDNVDFADSLQEVLQAVGLDVTTVHDGRSALATALLSVPDAAILDIGMPGLNGYELARALRANASTASLPLIAVSGWGQPNDKQLAAQAGFDRHFVKPVAPDVLLETLTSLSASNPGEPAAIGHGGGSDHSR